MTKALVARLLEVDEKDILTAKEAAKILGIQHGSALKAAERGGLEGMLVGRTWFFMRTQVENYRTRRYYSKYRKSTDEIDEHEEQLAQLLH
jgi:excisionase family DNA binding protein